LKEPLEISEPDLHQRPDRVLEPSVPSEGKGLLIALPHLGRIDPLFETIITGYQELLDPLPRVSRLHERSLAAHISV
jgi:hypothetical protein